MYLAPLPSHIFQNQYPRLHLGILQRFRQLYDSVENSASSQAEKSSNVQQFLLSAEARYVRYLALLDGFAGNNDASCRDSGSSFLDAIPLPPWYLRDRTVRADMF